MEIGLVHTPWNDFESKIYHYRMRGKTYLDEVGVSTSADFGLVAMGYFGGEVDKDFQKSMNKKYPGRYGSFAVGLYNGGGYKAEENNENKVLHARVTVRPIPNGAMTGLQLSGYIITGKANVAEINNVEAPDYQATAGMLTYEHRYATFYGQYVTGKGNKSGSWSDQSTYWGYSFHSEGKLGTNWRAMFRYDYFDPDDSVDDDGSNVLITGMGYDFGKGNIVLLDYQVESWEASAVDNATQIQASMQVSF